MDLIPRTFAFENVALNFFSFVHPETGELWIEGKAIAKSLNYSDPGAALSKHLKNSPYKRTWTELLDANINISLPKNWQPNTTMINKSGVAELIRKNKLRIRRRDVQIIANYFETDLTIVDRGKKQSIISTIIDTFHFTKCIPEFPIDPYRVDLYFPEEKLAVECDGFNHSSYNDEYERERQCFIETALNCTFYRFNPDEPYFSIHKHIGNIFKLIVPSELRILQLQGEKKELQIQLLQKENEWIEKERKYRMNIEDLLLRTNTTRESLEKIENRSVPDSEKNRADKERRAVCCEYEYRGNKRIRVTRNRSNKIEVRDKVAEQCQKKIR